jgi:predicted nucleotidyltransferase
MKIAAVICEFNPFHNGHALLARKAREGGATHIIGIMSGNFVQRGEPACVCKAQRVSAALDNGFDLVLELPVPYAASGAAHFAGAGAKIADACGCVDWLVFGSECGDAALLDKTAALLRSPETDALVPALLETGVTYAAARENAVRAKDPVCAEILKNPNDILALEYINALNSLGSGIVPRPVKREGSAHGSAQVSGCIASSSEIRRRMNSGGEWECFVPHGCGETPLNPVEREKFETLMLHTLRGISAGELARCPDISEGMENRLVAAAAQASSLDEFYSLAKTKRYTHARIRRAALSALLGITAQDADLPVPYLRLLGFTGAGAEIIRAMKGSAKLPLISKTADFRDAPEAAQRVFDLECRAGDIYSLLLSRPLPAGEEKRFVPIKKP